MRWLRWLIVLLAVIDAGYMFVDGIHALTTGDYITPSSGQLGPWTHAVEAIGLAPRSTIMKAIFVVYGAIWLGATVAFVARARWAWRAMLVLAIGSLWYFVVGTVTSALSIVLLLAVRPMTDAPPK